MLHTFINTAVQMFAMKQGLQRVAKGTQPLKYIQDKKKQLFNSMISAIKHKPSKKRGAIFNLIYLSSNFADI